MQTVIESKFAGLEAPSPVSPWNGLNLYFVDVNQSPENYLKTIDYVTASSPLLNLVFLHNTDTLFTSPKECFWPQYKLYRDSLKESFSFMTQVQSSIESEELSGMHRISANPTFQSRKRKFTNVCSFVRPSVC